MRIPPETLAWWAEEGEPGLMPDEIARVKAAMGPTVPADYLDFLRKYGFVDWDIDIPESFEYRLGQGDQVKIKRDGSISHLWRLDQVELVAARRKKEPDLARFFPFNYFPIGGTGGQDEILMELTPTPGRIWFWPEREDDWGTGDNTELGFVAETFTDFIEGLRLEE